MDSWQGTTSGYGLAPQALPTARGLLPIACWGSATVQLRRGDVVVLYSDGIAESFSPGGEEFGTAGVERAVAALAGRDAKTITRGLLDAAASFREGREAEDDVTILAMRYTGAGEEGS